MMMTHGQMPNPADVPPQRFQPMRSAYLTLLLDSIDEAERIYRVLAFRFAMLRDKFGTSWMILHERPTPQSV
jgi:PhnB protein